MRSASIVLKVTGVLMMLASLVHFMFGLTFLHFFSASITMGSVPKERAPLLFAVLILAAVSSLAVLIAGIVALVNSTEPLKAGQTVRWGFAALVLGIISEISVRVFGYESSMIYMASGIFMPLIHLIPSVIFLNLAKKGYRLHGTGNVK